MLFCYYSMAINVILLVILIGTTFLVFATVESNPTTHEAKKVEIRRKINSMKNATVKSIKSEDGDIIDCIDMYKQPAFDHPALKNHAIQMAPSYDPKMEEATGKTNKLDKKNDQDISVHLASQLWKKNGECPKGTIPVRRLKEKELLRANSIKDYGRKTPSFPAQHNKLNFNFRQQNRSMAILLTEGYSYSGAKADIQVWNPYVEADDEYSISQISLKNGPYYQWESVEAGWAVNPSVYGDRQTRLFVYWTVDSSKTTGCFDLTCPGFVQTNHELALGAAIHPVSVVSGLPYEITLYIFRDPVTNNWWVEYGERIYLGYWPHSLFSLLRGNAHVAEWGGEVFSQRLGQPPHTKTQMGNGQFAEPYSGNSGHIKRIQVRENSVTLKFPEWVYAYSDEYTNDVRCYDVDYVSDYIEDPEFFYGGPGQNPTCP